MFSKIRSWFNGLSTAGKVGIVAGASFLGIAAANSNDQASVCTQKISYSTQTQTIDFDTKNVQDGNLAKGNSKVTTVGVEGEKKLKHKLITYSPEGCKDNRDIVISKTVTKQPVTEVTHIGTYVAPPEPTPAPTSAPAPRPTPTSTGNCNPNYTPCVPNSSYDIDCPDIGMQVSVTGVDVYNFDADGDGIGCEAY